MIRSKQSKPFCKRAWVDAAAVTADQAADKAVPAVKVGLAEAKAVRVADLAEAKAALAVKVDRADSAAVKVADSAEAGVVEAAKAADLVDPAEIQKK